MQTDFLDAHDRHMEDAEFLGQHNRLANADHLYGISAECGLKSLMLAFGMPFDEGRPRRREDRVHADRIWQRYEAYRHGHLAGIGYSLPVDNPFDDWNIDQRYGNRTNFDRNRVRRHQMGARLVRDLVTRARLEGLI